MREDKKESKKEQFIIQVSRSMADSSFVKLSLGNYKGDVEHLKKILIKPIVIKDEKHWSFTYRYQTNDVVKNYLEVAGLNMLVEFVQKDFHIATLFTTQFDLIYENIHNKKFVLRKTAPSVISAPSSTHDVKKKRAIRPEATYLKALGIADKHGKIYKATQDKYRQINHYINMLKSTFKNLPKEEAIHIVDMGAGKGYLTFSLYDHLTNSLNLDVHVTGVESRKELVDLCNMIANESKFEQLKFVEGNIEEYQTDQVDLLIALHACDTATDDAIYKGITSEAKVIVVAPCCHKQIRREFDERNTETDLDYLLKYGVFKERQAEMVTDGIRGLILEYYGYRVKVAEFISDAHTPKNVMIIATKTERVPKSDEQILMRINAAMNYFGIDYHHLGRALGI
jgi:hypothetical protein